MAEIHARTDERRETASNQMSAINTTADQWRAIGAVAEVPISDIRTPVRPRGSNQPSKVWPRRCLAARTSPRGWRRTERLLERAGECSFRVVANHLGNLCEGRAGVAELLSRDLHAPTGEVVHRRHANQTDEAVGQRRTR